MKHSFKLEDNMDKNKKVKTDYSLFLMIFFILVAVICISVYFVMKHGKSDSKKYVNKIDENKGYVYTSERIKNEKSESGSIVYDKIPAINLQGSKYKQINNEIKNKYQEVIKNDPYFYEYHYNQSKNILSLVVKYSYYPQETIYPVTYFNTYNIDLVSGNILTDAQLLEMYDVTEKQLQTYLEAKFKKYYMDIVNNGYYTKKECNYSCFIKNRGISTNYLENISFYVDDGKLTLFKYYYRDSVYNEVEFFTDDTYQFLIKK